jgi:hypothetical protein
MREPLKEVVERALKRELAARRNLRPHAQLGIPPNTSGPEIAKAYARLRSRYETISIAEYGPGAVAAANEIATLLQAARDAMLQGPTEPSAAKPLPALAPAPRADETYRALATLRAAIARRLAEAEEHKRAARLREAARGFESVLLLDRGNEPARQALRELRLALTPKPSNALSRVLSRVFKRSALADDASARDA